MGKQKAGQLAPEFMVRDVFGLSQGLSQYRGQFVLVSFFRQASCAYCTLRLRELTETFGQYRALYPLSEG
jgi:peroxiredoxin Q/BCP